jgi:NAD(P)H dehydrogenase (quinone)
VGDSQVGLVAHLQAHRALTRVRQSYEGRMDHSAATTSTVQDLLGRDPVHFGRWASTHRQELLDQRS